MSPPETDVQRQKRFATLYECSYEDVVRFVRRRGGAASAEDVAHEAFFVAWRRFDVVPKTPPEARAWVFGAARHLLRSSIRGQARRDALAVGVGELQADVPMEHEDAEFRLDLIAAWRSLKAGWQEVLALYVWEQLPARLAAEVLGISSATYRVRLHRARNALRRHLGPVSPCAKSTGRIEEKNA